MTRPCNTSWRLPTAGPLIIGGDLNPPPDGEAILKDSDGNIISITLIPSGGSEDILAPDAVLEVNGNSFGNVRSNETRNLLLRDQNNNDIPNTLAFPQITVDTNQFIDEFPMILRDLLFSGNQLQINQTGI